MAEHNSVPRLSRNRSGRYKSGSRVDVTLLIEFALLAATGVYLLVLAITLLRAFIVGAEVLSVMEGIGALLGTLAAVFFLLRTAVYGTWAASGKNPVPKPITQEEVQRQIINRWKLRWLIYSGVLALCAAVHLVAFPMLAEREIDTALNADDRSRASDALEAAGILGRDGDEELRQAVYNALEQPETERAVWLLELYHERKPQDDDLTSLLFRSTADAALDRRPERASALLDLLLIVNKAQAVELTRTFNEDGVAAAQAGNTALARAYFVVVAGFDDAHPTADTTRTPAERATTRFQLARVQEQEYDFDAARSSYGAALRLDDTLLDAYYMLSSLLLVEFADDPVSLEEAINVAAEGRAHIDPVRCADSQDLDDPDVLYQSWTCFLLLTTEAGARFELLSQTTDAAMPYLNQAAFGPVSAVLMQAMQLAEANDQFGPGLKTAEAYYWYARLTEPDTNLVILQNILTQRDPNSPRHQEWANYATDKLGQTVND